MRPKRLVHRQLAKLDIESALDQYLAEAGSEIAISFVDEIESTFRRISRNPSAGSPRYAHELDLADLRFWPVRRFPYLIFYADLDSHVDVWRILHSHSDIPAWMSDPDSGP